MVVNTRGFHRYRARCPAILGAAILLLGSTLLYTYTLAPTVLWGDDAMFQRGLAVGSLPVYPVWAALSRLFARLPWGDLAYRANLASAVYAVVAVLFLFLAVQTLVGDVRAAVAAGAALAASHLFWLEAVRAEVLTLNTLFFCGGLWSLLRWRQSPKGWAWLALSSAFWSLGVMGHLQLALALPGVVVLILTTFPPQRRKGVLLLSVLALAVGGLLFVLLSSTFRGLLFNAADQIVRRTPLTISPRRLAWHALVLAYQFPALGLLAVPGLRRLWQQERNLALALAFLGLLPAAFAATYGSLESYALYLPFCALVALLVGLGVAQTTEHWGIQRWIASGIVLLALQIGLYRLAPLVVERFAPGIMPSRDLPGRPAAMFFLWPPKRDYFGARQFAETTLDALPPQAILIADWTLFAPLRYVQDVEGRRPDVGLVVVQADLLAVPEIQNSVGRRPLYLANADPRYYPLDELQQHFRLQPFGQLVALLPRESSP